jgi:DNA (cytosine-5)-methyltransferase 1
VSCTIGSLFTGYGGLDMGVAAALGESRVAWTSDIDKGACKAIAHHHPDTPNLGDITTIDWATVEPVDVITGGSPCQDLSAAGQRAGMTTGTRSNLWVAMREAIAILRPRLVVWENVRGAYSAPADSGVEPCPGCVGDRPGVSMRALGRVLGDLSELGYDAVWHGLRAADVGAPHARFRVFVVAYPQGSPWRLAHRNDASTPDPTSRRRREHDPDLRGLPVTHTDGHDILPTPTARDDKGHNQRGDTSCLTGALLPTPRATDGTNGGPNQRGSSGDLMLPSAVHQLLPTPTASQFPSNKSLSPGATERPALGAINQLLPTPSVADATGGHATRSGTHGTGGPDLRTAIANTTQWGTYAPAIEHWQNVTGHPVPPPTETGPQGAQRLSPRFVEWMMGYPQNWTDLNSPKPSTEPVN